MDAFYFAALRFTEDENLAGRVYWYLSGRPLTAGERVFAPVGPHDRIQKARVERFLCTDSLHAPYDVALIKRVAAREGDREVTLGGVCCREFGGTRYDGRHYTRFGRLLFSDELPAEHAGFTAFVAPMSEDEAVYLSLARGNAALLVGGEGEKIGENLLGLLSGRAPAGPALTERTSEALKAFLG